MSWSFSVPPTKADEFDEAATEAHLAYYEGVVSKFPEDEQEATAESMADVLLAVCALVDSGILGTGKVLGSLSGHANPDHRPRAGMVERHGHDLAERRGRYRLIEGGRAGPRPCSPVTGWVPAA